VGITLNKPRLHVDQIISATYASKRFGEIRKKAKELPQFISENNCIDTVVLDYKAYEAMYAEIEELREIAWEISIARRLEKANATNVKYSLQEVMGEEYEEFCTIDPDSISDEELFE
jgi:F0F1-type ATP synthase delta subunit